MLGQALATLRSQPSRGTHSCTNAFTNTHVKHTIEETCNSPPHQYIRPDRSRSHHNALQQHSTARNLLINKNRTLYRWGGDGGTHIGTQARENSRSCTNKLTLNVRMTAHNPQHRQNTMISKLSYSSSRPTFTPQQTFPLSPRRKRPTSPRTPPPRYRKDPDRRRQLLMVPKRRHPAYHLPP